MTLSGQFRVRFWADIDARVAIARTIRKRCKALMDDCGGHESAQRGLLVSRLAFLSVLIESQEVTAAETGSLESGVYTQNVNALLGLVKTLGLEKRIKNVRDLKSYLEERSAA